ncbi:adaptin ear-binding coat-associated protein 1 NECAP-1 [Pseudovirgaria hyperparasitica]|uniref:Adaptin ear-binding coat-associated protein 1 NECAP-1 n=1 Tax=Pseudovirgaria hyperparasitica TaxID=470096 RepID=A0A6A6VU21_9PEZI|nr:adaptin ear-binding coat-associated protein 1 NECAP-1 [Pseudovirgaria hyperparasitica]KAF2752741.1 adaptin ear-binding coat-associated protein 1 NECAP-1 [Pseudovirgaria hyperparasitica]
MDTDPLTGAALPATAIQRVLYICPRAHIYQIPPLRSTKGHSASQWTAVGNPTAQEIFTARLRIVETAIPTQASASTADHAQEEKVTVNVLLEEASSGNLFAAVPYTDEGAVEPAVDSSRFFAIRVVGDGRKAVLGLGFEERAEAVDFSIALQDAQRVLGLQKKGAAEPGSSRGPGEQKSDVKRDYSLKEGETIKVEIGGRRGRNTGSSTMTATGGGEDQGLSKFTSKPPLTSGGGAFPLIPPPPSASAVKSERRRRSRNMQYGSASTDPNKEAKELGFDDGEFGEFQ